MGDDAMQTESNREKEWPWLGTRKFWLALAVVFALAVFGVWRTNRRLSRFDAVVPVVTLSGPHEATPGQIARYAVLVRDRFGAALPNAVVRVGFSKTSFLELGRATTGDGGDASVEVHFPADFAESRSVVAIAEIGVADGTDSMVVAPKTPGAGSIFVSTDKPLYQPGQVVHVRALAMAGDEPLADKPSVIEVRTPDGVKVFHADKPTSGFGVVAADFPLADQVKLGSYTVDVTTTVTPAVAGVRAAVTVQSQHQVDVKRYALPKLGMKFEDVSPFEPDAPLTGTARATWIFGEPVTKGAITVTLEQPGSGARRVTGKTDKLGAFHFELPPAPGNHPPRGSFTLRARLDLEGGIHTEVSQPIATLGGELKLEPFPESGVVVPGVEQTVFVVVTQSASKAGVTVRALPDGPPAKTSEAGIATVTVHPDAKDDVVHLAAYADDGSDGKVDVPTTSDSLVVRPDRASYAAGESARVTVLGAEAGDHVSLRMTKGTEPIAMGSCVVAAVDRGCEAALAIPPSASGLAWIHALSLPTGKREVRVGKRLVIAGMGSRDLTLHVTPDKAAWAPRDVGAIDVAVTGAGGAPVAAQLGVAVADEAVFALANVRPDLEKIFFTVGRDVAGAQAPYYGFYGDGSASRGLQRPLPAAFEAAAAYDASTAVDVRSTVLAALTTMPATGGVDAATSSVVSSRASAAVARQKDKLAAWCIVAIAAFSVAAFAAFGVYGVARFRRPLLLATPTTDAGDITTLRLETRALFADFLTAVLAPPVLAVAGVASTELFTDRGYGGDRAIIGCWFILAAFCSVLLVRAALRVRRAFAARGASTLRRVLFFLPLAIFFSHLAILLAIADDGSRFRVLFGYRQDALVVPLVIVAAAQLTCGLLSVVRQTQLRAVTKRGRVWLFASRATFLGLPVTIVLAGFFVWAHHKEIARADWTDFASDAREADEYAQSSDSKEGGTGVRAKGEEGSMGNPSSRGTGARFGAQGAGNDDARAQVHVRDFFPETLLWAPDVVTDPAGHARIQVPFADSITTWRFGLSAVSHAGQLGSTTIPLVVKQDFFVDASLPPVLTQGDEIAVPVTVFNYVDAGQDVTLELTSDGVSVVGAAKLALHLSKGEARGVRFVVKADKAGERVVHLAASSATHADAMERTIVVTPNGQPITRTINGRVNGSAEASVTFPDNAIDGGDDFYAKIYGGPLSQVSEGLDGVFHMPYGCFEQTSSTTYPSVLALQFLSRTKSVSPELEKKARDYIAHGYQRIVAFEVPGGGFSLYGKEPAATVLSAYGLLELSDMASVASVDAALLERTRQWLYGKQTPTGGWVKPSVEGKVARDAKDDLLVTAFVAWALAASAAEPANDTRLNRLLDLVAKDGSHEGEDPYALALRAIALVTGRRIDDARPLLERLARQAIRTDDGVHFASQAVGVMYSYGASMDVEVTGLATHALALGAMEPELRAGALDWLAARRDPRGTWSTTQATIAAMRALLDDARPVTKGPEDIHVLVDGQEQETFTLAPNARDVHHLVSLRRFATTGRHAVDIRVTGDGDVSYQLVATHYLPWQKAPGSSLGLDVGYAPNAVAPGDTLSCHVHLDWKGNEPARMPLVEIGVPPAFEVESDDLDALTRSASSAVQRYTVERGKVTLYLVSLAEGAPMAIDLRMRALWHASVVAPASAAYLYYEPEVRAETASVRVRAL